MTFLEIIKTGGAVCGSALSILAFIMVIIKPIRKKVVSKIITVTHKKEIEAHGKELNSLAQELSEVKGVINEIKELLFINEKDRLKGELFNCGNRCRRGIPLQLEEYRYIQEVYQKYSDELHCNHNGTEEYNFIRDYFNSLDNQEKLK